MKHFYSLPNSEPSCLEAPRIKFISRQAKGVFANILLDDWFKRSFCELPFSERLLKLFLQEVIPERRIASIKYAPQEHTNLNPDKHGIRVDVEATDVDGTRFLVEMQRERQDYFYERALYNASHCIIRQMDKGEESYNFASVYFIGVVDFSLHDDPDRVLYRYSLHEDNDGEKMTNNVNFIFLELPNCGKALTPEATLLDNVCFSMHNMQFLEERPAELRQEIFDLLFQSVEIATFTPEDKIKYDFNMTTERDIRNQIRYAENNGMKKQALSDARYFKALGIDPALVAKGTGLTEEQVRAL